MSAKLEWDDIDDVVLSDAIDEATRVLADERTPVRLAMYYDRGTNYAGATFAGLTPNPAEEITASDLIAVTSLGVSIGDHAIRLFLEDDEIRQAIAEALRGLPAQSLKNASDEELQPMADLYELVKKTLATPGAQSSNRWVTASKVVARKRPDLFPVRDNVVCTGLGILGLKNYLSDWRVFRRLMQNDTIESLLAALPPRIAESSSSAATDCAGETPLRLLDASLWMRFSGREPSESE